MILSPMFSALILASMASSVVSRFENAGDGGNRAVAAQFDHRPLFKIQGDACHSAADFQNSIAIFSICPDFVAFVGFIENVGIDNGNADIVRLS